MNLSLFMSRLAIFVNPLASTLCDQYEHFSNDYSEKEMKLLEAIVDSIRGPSASATMGAFLTSNKQPIEIRQFSEGENLKAIIIFSSSIESFISFNAITSPSLEQMLIDSNLKKTLWQKLKPLQAT